MGREIEIKIPLTDAEYESIYNSFTFEHFFKTDRYFSRYDTHEERVQNGEPRVIRIRTEQDMSLGEKKSYFCIKYKTVQNGIELNTENETFVQDETVIENLLKVSGYHIYFDKQKDAFSVYSRCDYNDAIEFHLELEKVNGLKYVEIEVTDGTAPADEVTAALEKFVTRLGLDVSKKDSRSWMEIINHL